MILEKLKNEVQRQKEANEIKKIKEKEAYDSPS